MTYIKKSQLDPEFIDVVEKSHTRSLANQKRIEEDRAIIEANHKRSVGNNKAILILSITLVVVACIQIGVALYGVLR